MSISLSIACPEDGVIHDKRIMCRNVQGFFYNCYYCPFKSVFKMIM